MAASPKSRIRVPEGHSGLLDSLERLSCYEKHMQLPDNYEAHKRRSKVFAKGKEYERFPFVSSMTEHWF